MSVTSSANATRLSLLERARQRDAEARRVLVDLYGPLVASWCQKCLPNSHAVADCVQEIFSATAVSLHAFEPKLELGSFRAWLWTITRNKIRDFIRRNGKHVRAKGGSSMVGVLHNVPDENLVPLEEPTQSIQLQQLTRRALDQVQCEFEHKTWQAFWRCVVDGMNTAQVAEELGVSAATVRQHKSRVLRRLRQQLGDVG